MPLFDCAKTKLGSTQIRQVYKGTEPLCFFRVRYTINTEATINGISQTGNKSFTLKQDIDSGSTYDVDWGDGSDPVTDQTAASLTKVYATAGNYTVTVTTADKYAVDFSASTQTLQEEGAGQVLTVSFPDDMFRFKNNIGSAWRGCSNLTTFNNVDIGFETVASLNSTWRDCSSLTSFPLIDLSSATNIIAAWRDCSGLTSFPQLDCSNITGMTNTWFGCSSLTSFPAIDFDSNENFGATWRNCSGLTSFPSIDLSSGTNFRQAWRGCTSLASYPANQFDSTGTLTSNAFDLAFLGCALTTGAIENILTSLVTNGASNISLSLNGGTNAAKSTWTSAANTAYNTLISRGWTIVFNS